eukprot:CAMPEP_0171532880 /NCGR_PEP_ID=MMETSP0959-20130129/15227_1 /TAXON_ID=87120 /ORGANISM="Aurantiochytrium limacinum, Strain ATCCMYA-1381" /LENGTH=50 /DNA_ID=CAMNT_0012077529 /DNA_START=67 /DNA_END=219 /DNA_ORIENTATION=-
MNLQQVLTYTLISLLLLTLFRETEGHATEEEYLATVKDIEKEFNNDLDYL